MASSAQIAGKEILLALGASLIFAGIILRGFARSSRRARALRHQHWLHERKTGETQPPERRTGWFEENLQAIANSAVVVGLATVFGTWFLGH